MSSHVGSRWYRAPEISILENKYDSASDMWSFGCCMYELLRMINSDPAQPTRNHILYPGTSCYPLSPMAVKPNDDETQNMISDNDQMKIILRKLGKQKDYDLSFI